jgi:hypothetical protein
MIDLFDDVDDPLGDIADSGDFAEAEGKIRHALRTTKARSIRTE